MLAKLGGQHHVVSMLDVVRSKEATTLVLEYFPHKHFRDYYLRMTPEDLRRYMRALFEALAHLHKHNVVHRDIKPRYTACWSV